MKDEKFTVFIVDDDKLFLKSLEIEFSKFPNVIIHPFLSGEACLEKLDINPDIVILDYHLEGTNKKAINGIEVLDEIKKSKSNIPVIILSAQDKIDVAVSCMHHKAFDYVVKSETAFMRLQKIIVEIFKFRKMEAALKWYVEHI